MKTITVSLLLFSLYVGWTHSFHLADYGVIIIGWALTARTSFRVGLRSMEHRILLELGTIIKECKDNGYSTPSS